MPSIDYCYGGASKVAIIGGLCISLSIVLMSAASSALPLVQTENMTITIEQTCIHRQNCSKLADNITLDVVRREEGGNGNNENGEEKGSNEKKCNNCTGHKKAAGEFFSSYTVSEAALYLSIAAHLACVVLLTLMCVMCCTWFEKLWNFLLVVAAGVAMAAALSTVFIVWTMCLTLEMIKQQVKDLHAGTVDFDRTHVGLGTVGIMLSAVFSALNLMAAISLSLDFKKTGRHEAVVAIQKETKSSAGDQ
jgi:hypothetical protein